MTVFSEIGRYLLMIKGMFSRPENMKMYWKEFIHQCAEIGIGALGTLFTHAVLTAFHESLDAADDLVA